MKRYAAFAAFLLALSQTACNTVEGVGEDVEGAGESIEDASEDVRD